MDHAIEEDRRRYRWVDSPVDKHFDSSDDESYYGAVAYHHPEPIVAAPVVRETVTHVEPAPVRHYTTHKYVEEIPTMTVHHDIRRDHYVGFE